jgi:hypothetical protein
VTLSIHASTQQEAIPCLDFLLGLRDNHYKVVTIAKLSLISDYERCPLTEHNLHKILSNSQRRTTFCRMSFTLEQCLALVGCNKKRHLSFHFCKFEDGGASFVKLLKVKGTEIYASRSFTFSGTLPFAKGHWISFLKTMGEHGTGQSVVLSGLKIDQDSCRGVAKIEDLKLDGCKLEDHGNSLIESVMAGRGPRALCISMTSCRDSSVVAHPFETLERWKSFMNALNCDNCHLNRLSLSGLSGCDDILRALADALYANTRLVHLSLSFMEMSNECWIQLLRAITSHPSLRTLAFVGIRAPVEEDEARRCRTEAVAKMIFVNQQVEKIKTDQTTFCHKDWVSNVAPRIEYNKYRTRFLNIQKTRMSSTREALFGQALAHLQMKPSLIWMLLSMNHDIISCLGCGQPKENLVLATLPKHIRYPSLELGVSCSCKYMKLK